MEGGWDNGIYAVGGGGFVWLAQMVWGKVFSTEGKTHDRLLEQMSARLTTQETSLSAQNERIVTLETGLDKERSQRRTAEDKVHLLELYVVALKAELKRHGIEVPAPETFADYTRNVVQGVET